MKTLKSEKIYVGRTRPGIYGVERTWYVFGPSIALVQRVLKNRQKSDDWKQMQETCSSKFEEQLGMMLNPGEIVEVEMIFRDLPKRKKK